MAHIFGSVRCQSDSRFPLTPVRFNFSDQDFNERCRLRARQGILQLAYKWMLASIFSLPSGLPLQFRHPSVTPYPHMRHLFVNFQESLYFSGGVF